MFFSPLEQFDAITFVNIYFKINNFFIDLSLTNILLPFVVLIFIVNFFLNFVFSYFTIIPKFWQLAFERLFIFIINLIDQQIGTKGFVYVSFIFSLFTFILISNLLSLVPFGFALTTHIVMIFFLSLSLGIGTFITGLKVHGMRYFSLFIPDCPFVLLPLLIIIELFSYIIRSFSLSIRLSANIMAGHTLVHIISTFILKISGISVLFFFLLLGSILAVLLLELGVAFLQAYVFVTLVCIYLSDSIHLNH